METIKNYYNNFIKQFKKPIREEIIEDFISEKVNSIFHSQAEFSNFEIGMIVERIVSSTKDKLSNRKELLDKDLRETINAINSL